MTNQKKSIIIVEDEPDLLANYSAALQKHGYQTQGYDNKQSAMAAFSQQLPDMAILDVGLGHEADAGFELCHFLRSQSETLPILMFTARDDEIDVVSGLRLGADDYLSKDISLAHLLARIASLFRRQQALAQTETSPDNYSKGQLEVLTDNMQIRWADQLIELTVTEFWMVASLSRYPGQVKTREQLMHDANIYVDDSTITSHIKRIRKKFQAHDPEFSCIDTVHGMGYRWKVE